MIQSDDKKALCPLLVGGGAGLTCVSVQGGVRPRKSRGSAGRHDQTLPVAGPAAVDTNTQFQVSSRSAGEWLRLPPAGTVATSQSEFQISPD